jgi:hypothetical protein
MLWQHRRVGQGKARHSDEQKTSYGHREKSHNKTPFVAHMIFSTNHDLILARTPYARAVNSLERSGVARGDWNRSC